MLPLQTQYTTIDLLSQLVTQIKAAAASGFTDLNRVAEDVLVPVFKAVYGYEHLENLNRSASLNYPGIDLADKEARVAFQITSTATTEKVAHTLTQFTQAGLYGDYDRLVIFILVEKQQILSQRDACRRSSATDSSSAPRAISRTTAISPKTSRHSTQFNNGRLTTSSART